MLTWLCWDNVQENNRSIKLLCLPQKKQQGVSRARFSLWFPPEAMHRVLSIYPSPSFLFSCYIIKPCTQIFKQQFFFIPSPKDLSFAQTFCPFSLVTLILCLHCHKILHRLIFLHTLLLMQKEKFSSVSIFVWLSFSA